MTPNTQILSPSSTISQEKNLFYNDSHAEEKLSPSAQLLFFLIYIFALTIPNEGILGMYDPSMGNYLRTPGYYVGLLIIPLSVLYLPEIFQFFIKSVALPLFLMILLIGIFLCYLLNSFDPGISFSLPFKNLYMACFFLVLHRKKEYRQQAIYYYLIGWVIFAFYSLYLVTTGQFDLNIIEEGVVRAHYLMGINANLHTVISSVGIILFYEKLINSNSATQILLFGGFTLVGLLIVFYGASRTGIMFLIACLVSITIKYFFEKTQQSNVLLHRAKVFIIALISVLLGTYFISTFETTHLFYQSTIHRFEDTVEKDDYGDRNHLTQATLKIAKENPFGVGWGNTDALLGISAHNDYARIFAEVGILGGILLTIMIFIVARNTIAWIKLPGNFGIGIIMIFLLVRMAQGSSLSERNFWFFLVLHALPPAKNTAKNITTK